MSAQSEESTEQERSVLPPRSPPEFDVEREISLFLRDGDETPDGDDENTDGHGAKCVAPPKGEDAKPPKGEDAKPPKTDYRMLAVLSLMRKRGVLDLDGAIGGGFSLDEQPTELLEVRAFEL